MKAWCHNCREERQVPFEPSADDMRCEACGMKLGRVPRKGPKRTTKSSQPKRDWTMARYKVEQEEVCRAGREGRCQGQLEAAHITGREYDPPWTPDESFDPEVDEVYDLTVRPVSIVPLCRRHHRLYDDHCLDLLPYLTIDEQVRAVLDLDGLENARVRTAPLAYQPEAAVSA